MIVAFIKGTAPSMAVEIGRRAIPGHVRSTFQDAEKHIKDKGDAPATAA
jgi:chemotaxis protein MotA